MNAVHTHTNVWFAILLFLFFLFFFLILANHSKEYFRWRSNIQRWWIYQFGDYLCSISHLQLARAIGHFNMWSKRCNAYRCNNILVRILMWWDWRPANFDIFSIFILCFSIFMVSFLYPKTWLLYVTSAILGTGAALIWTGQGNYLSLCSNASNISRNSGVFWAMLQCRFVYKKKCQ